MAVGGWGAAAGTVIKKGKIEMGRGEGEDRRAGGGEGVTMTVVVVLAVLVMVLMMLKMMMRKRAMMSLVHLPHPQHAGEGGGVLTAPAA